MALHATAFVAPVVAPRALAPGGRTNTAPSAPVRDRKGKGFGSSSDGFDWRLATGIVSGLALRGLTRRNYGGDKGGGKGGYGGGGGGRGGGGYGNMSAQEVQQRTDAKRARETSQFEAYQRRLLNVGLPPRDDMYWDREDRRIFKTAHVTTGINFGKYDDIPVESTGGQGTEKPITTFQDACDKYNLPQGLTDTINKCGYTIPTPVQKHSIPAVLDGTDVMVSAQTGSGKTAAFLIPIITAALNADPEPLGEGAVCPTSLVMAPTRELCQQIAQEAERLCYRTRMRIACVYGGADAGPQLKAIAEGCNIIICTPGRLDDFLGRGVISMKKIKFMAIDEADRMLDMGFEPQIRSIIDGFGMPMPATGEAGGRQTMMFSATFPQEMQDMALDFLDPSYLWIGVGRVGATTSNVEQRFENVGYDDKYNFLLDKIKGVKNAEGEEAKTIVFANQKSVCDDIAWRLSDAKIRSSPIHGGLSQEQRDRSLRDLKSGRISVLVATDVAARGLDLPGVDHVINYDLPLNGEDYVHRIGRTGRIGNKGIATSLVGNSESALRDIVRSLKENQEAGDEGATEVPGWLEDMARNSSGARGRR